MEIQKSTIDSDFKLLTYSNGVQYIVYHSASWLVGCNCDKNGSELKDHYFPKKATPEQRIKQWLKKKTFISTGGCWGVRSLAQDLGITTQKVYSILRKSDWCDAEESFHTTRYGDCRKYYVYRYNG